MPIQFEISQSPPDKNSTKLVFKPDRNLRRDPTLNRPMFSTRSESINVPNLVAGIQFGGQRLNKSLAKSLSKGKLIGWGPVPTGQTGRGAKLYEDSQIWLQEEFRNRVVTSVISDERTTRRKGARNGYTVLWRLRTTSVVERNDALGLRITSKTDFLADKEALNDIAQMMSDATNALNKKVNKNPKPVLLGDKQPDAQIPNLSTRAFGLIGSTEQWIRFKPSTPDQQYVFRTGLLAFDQSGKRLFREVEELELPPQPHASQAAQNFGWYVEGAWNLLNIPYALIIMLATIVGAQATLSGGIAGMAGAWPFVVLAAVVDLVAVVVASVAGFLMFLNSNYVAPGAGMAAEWAYDAIMGTGNPGTGGAGSSQGPGSGQTLQDLLGGNDPIENGYGMSELYEFMESMVPGINRESEDDDDDDDPEPKDPPKDPPDDQPDDTPDETPDEPPEDGGDGPVAVSAENRVVVIVPSDA